MEKNTRKNNLLLISLHRKTLLDNYQKSVERLLSTSKLMKNVISKNNLEKNIGVWGILNTKNNFRVWKEIKKSDRIIFLHNKKFFSKAKVIGIKENKEIPKKIWKDSTFIENRNLLIFLENIEPIDLDYEACIPMIIEPNMSDAYYFSIIKVNEKKRDFLITTFGSVEKALEFLDNTKGKNSISDFLTRKQLAEETDMVIKEGINKQRIGQRKFRENVLSNFNYTCAVCNLTDREILEAAHIVPIKDEYSAGKTKNGICLCSNCHKMFDRGFFSFDGKYNIMISKQKKISNKIMKLLNHKKLGKHKISPSKEYLALHRAKFRIAN